MKFLKIGFCVFATALASISSSSSSSFPIQNNLLRIDGVDNPSSIFTPFVAFDDVYHSDGKTSYFWFDVDLFIAPFTDCSKLLLIRAVSEFTSGFIANANGHTEFDKNYDLWSGYVHVSPFVVKETSTGSQSSSFVVKKTWPISSSLTYTATSSFSTNYDIGLSAGVTYNVIDGVSASLKVDGGISFGFSNSIAVSGPEPTLSSQDAPQANDDTRENSREWSFQYHAIHAPSYRLETYTLLEIKNDAVGFNDYSLGVVVDIHSDAVAYLDWWWETHKDVDSSLVYYVNLGRMPD